MPELRRFALIIIAGLAVCALINAAPGQQNTPRQIPQADSSYIDREGTAHVTRIVPVPKTISPEAQRNLARVQSDAAVDETLAERRRKTDKWQTGAGEEFKKLYPVTVTQEEMAGVPRAGHYSVIYSI